MNFIALKITKDYCDKHEQPRSYLFQWLLPNNSLRLLLRNKMLNGEASDTNNKTVLKWVIFLSPQECSCGNLPTIKIHCLKSISHGIRKTKIIF